MLSFGSLFFKNQWESINAISRGKLTSFSPSLPRKNPCTSTRAGRTWWCIPACKSHSGRIFLFCPDDLWRASVRPPSSKARPRILSFLRFVCTTRILLWKSITATRKYFRSDSTPGINQEKSTIAKPFLGADCLMGR